MSKKTYLILCIFGGWFGLHKFATKQIGKGILYLFTYGLLFIGWFHDIYIAFKIYKGIDDLSVYNLDKNFKDNNKHNYVSGYINKIVKYIKGYSRK